MEPNLDEKRNWEDNGYCILPGLITEEAIDSLLDDLGQFRADCGETKDEFGFGQRIGLFHVENEKSLAISLHPKIVQFCQWAMQSEPLLFGSLSFEAGTEQELHMDSIFFHTEPAHHMVGVWIALEDIDEEAGPLYYVPGSHKWNFPYGEDVLLDNPEFNDRVMAARAGNISPEEIVQLSSEMGQSWTSQLLQQEKASPAARVLNLAKKGDVFFWHGRLAHGGTARINRELSRNSMVCHFISNECLFFDMNTFFVKPKAEYVRENSMGLSVLSGPNGAKYTQHEKPVTY